MPVEFGLQLSSFPPDVDGDGDTIGFYRRMVAALSPEFTTLWVSDHMQFGDAPVLEGWTRLTYLAALFPHLKVGHLVLGQGYRNPALLAKMGATLQHLTGGRFILGIGAGWHEEEYRAYGYGYPSRGARVAQLAEAIRSSGPCGRIPATFHGEHYHSKAPIATRSRPDPPDHGRDQRAEGAAGRRRGWPTGGAGTRRWRATGRPTRSCCAPAPRSGATGHALADGRGGRRFPRRPGDFRGRVPPGLLPGHPDPAARADPSRCGGSSCGRWSSWA